ncbi:ankyrin repeat domain-containing protein [Fimbriimonas ginsengisoli]|uniref:Ankyrin repeat protein n=1 Tax=Fimbriimonas ginsengisoli Gsoil 348 TaxID=661478 RepID=A0A068NUL4_FIMGI|nr:ankyrin repeat domain-containing protein [Fimbriimonas ginsengisoli]AIE86460.1 ankyrin repeat protein [Fimbriimonas ginsengisoli Gsoil 348]
MSEKAFFNAVKKGDLAEVQALLAGDPALVHARENDQATPLHFAAWKGHPEIAEVLIAAGADLQAHSTNGHWGTTPLHAAAHGNQKAVAEVLIKHGADINAKRAVGEGTPLAETRAHNATAVAKLLRAHGATE